MAVNLQSLGPLLKRSRRHAGLTQEELAESAGVSVRSLSDIERGAQQRPHVSTLRRLADALSLPPQERVAFLTAVDGHPPATPGRDGEHAGHVLDLDGMRRDERIESPAVLTFLLADLRDYTHFTMEQGDEAAARLTARFADLAHEVVTSYDGRVVELRGDEALCAFASTRNALRAALALQARFSQATGADPALPLRVGIGLDTGEAIPVSGGYRGAALNLAARLCAIAGAGEVFASPTVLGLARATEGVTFLDRGEVILKGVGEPVRVTQIFPEGACPLELRPLQATTAPHPTNLPDELNPFIGRAQEMGAISALLDQPTVRMVTLTGPGGTGKTRLALQLGSALLYAFRDGVFFASLGSLTDPALVPAALVRTLGLKGEDGVPPDDALRDYLLDKHLLLILDNFEHLLDAAPTVARLLDFCRELHVLVTSRIPLHLVREQEYPVPPLSLPDPAELPAAEAMERSEAVALFTVRARAVRPDFAVTGDNAQAVYEICRRLDGLPLALELAAARIKSLPPQLLLRQLTAPDGMGSMEILAGGAHDLPARLQSMRNAIAWSHNLLQPDRQALLRRLAVFVDGCTVEAAHAVCWGEGESQVLDALMDLVDQSLVRSEEWPGGAARFRMLETIREYALDRLEASGEADTVRGMHAAYYGALAAAAEPELTGPDQDDWFEQLDREHANLRAALAWLLGSSNGEPAVRLACALWRFWQVRGHLQEGSRWLEQAVQVAGVAPLLRAKALHGWSVLAHNLGSYRQATSLATESLELFRRLGDARGAAQVQVILAYIANDRGEYERSAAQYSEALELFRELGDRGSSAPTLSDLGCVRTHQGAFEEARALYTESLILSRELGDTRAIAIALLNLGDLAMHNGDLDRAIALFTDSLSLRRQLRDEAGISFVLFNLGEATWLQGHYERAASLLRESLTISHRVGNKRSAAYCLKSLAALTAAQGEAERAAQLWGIAEAWCERTDITIPPPLIARYEAPRSVAGAELGETVWSRMQERGRAMTVGAAIAYALADQE